MSKVKVYRPYQPSPEPNPDSAFWVFYLAAIVFGGMVTWMAVRSHFNVKDYQQGYEAYKTENCAEAIPHFKRITSRWLPVDVNQIAHRSQTRINECEAYQKALTYQEKGHLVSSLITYNSILARHPSTELRPSIQKKAGELFTQTEITQLTDPKLCNHLEPFRRNQIVEESSQKLPILYRACAQQYQTQEEYSKAVVFYEQFLKAYPQHHLSPETKQLLVQALIAEAQQQGAGIISQPSSSGYSDSSYTVVQIQNDSPTRMQLVFSGPEDRIEELEPCFECETFIKNKPESCPELGPIGRYTLPPGDYKIVVKSADEHRVTPYRGDWTLEAGNTYAPCFYIVNEPVNELPPLDLDSELSKPWGGEQRSPSPSKF
ncbi:hypothetical protein [Laspinema palackyanum]|uniref:hypothetical protein n=1 Tax=Laspinema palackyanum TaxID=3231601 RepID=UPI00345D6097|nr:hypothetical protein [Laspinema sp. D2c]